MLLSPITHACPRNDFIVRGFAFWLITGATVNFRDRIIITMRTTRNVSKGRQLINPAARRVRSHKCEAVIRARLIFHKISILIIRDKHYCIIPFIGIDEQRLFSRYRRTAKIKNVRALRRPGSRITTNSFVIIFPHLRLTCCRTGWKWIQTTRRRFRIDGIVSRTS